MAEKQQLSRGRGGKHNFPNAIPDNVEPGDNTKFLTHAMNVRALPRIDTSDPVQVENRINEYFTMCAVDDVKPTVKGFLNALRVAKSTLWEWKQGNLRAGTHQAIIVEAYDLLEEMWEHYMMNGKINPVSGIFLGKNNFGYSDKQDIVVTPNTQAERVDVAVIEAKYAELPEIED
jgi:hypothetical protein